MKKTFRTDVIVTVLILLAAAAAWLLWPRGGAGRVAVVQYTGGELRLPLNEDTQLDLPSNGYTVHLLVQEGGVRFVDSPCPDHTCENFGVLREAGDWAACLPAKVSVVVE